MRSFILASVVFLSACCVSEEEFSQEAEEAAACSAGDTCVLAGASQCLCARPVNASKAAELDALAQEVCCEGRAVSCVPFLNVRCENGRCMGNLPD
jgi:hypothetical protein